MGFCSVLGSDFFSYSHPLMPIIVQNSPRHQKLKNVVCLFQRKPFCEIFQAQIKVGALIRNCYIFAKSVNLHKKVTLKKVEMLRCY